MLLSKSFGYALRGVLYVALSAHEEKKVQIGEIAEKLSVPRHFLAKIMKSMVKHGVVDSTKGPYGGFSANKNTRRVKLIDLVAYTEGLSQFNTCVLSLRKCNARNPCPLHDQMLQTRNAMMQSLSGTSIGDLLDESNPNFVKSISAL